MARQHYWIIEVNGDPAKWEWTECATQRGGLDVQAYRSREEANADFYNVKKMYGHARIVKFVRAGEPGR